MQRLAAWNASFALNDERGLQRAQSRPAVAHGSGYLILKAFVGRSAAVLLLATAAPLIAVLAIAVKLSSSGPALYSQLRLGRLGQPFRIYKLRTMTHGCEAASGATWSAPQDPRVTWLGRILRQTHLDELPQLWNVVRGEMSLIGPRPERPEIAGELARRLPHYEQRLLVRPGLTGLAQVQLPPDVRLQDVAEKLSQDLFYIEHVSFFLDARIAASTVMLLLAAACNEACRLLITSAGRDARQKYPALRIDGDHAAAAPMDRKATAFDAPIRAAGRELAPAA